MAESFKVRALEIHDTFQMWSVEKMQRVFEFMLRNNMNTLVFHENNIVDNQFAIRVLKALLLVKYLKNEFKPTSHNISVLLLTSFNDNPAQLAEKTEQALDRLAKETYIQRNGDQYYFLTNEEKDAVEALLKECMESVVQLAVPLIVDVHSATTWADVK